MNTRSNIALAGAVVLALTGPLVAGTPSASASASASGPAPLVRAADRVPGEYIVTLDKRIDPAGTAAKLGLKPAFFYNTVLNGFAVRLTPQQLTLVRGSLGVEAVEEDGKVAVPDPATASAPAVRQGPAASSWGLDRIDQRDLPLDGEFITTGNGAGVTAYILDTGIDYGHSEFGGRATFGFDAVADGRDGADCNGHGTHVAGTVGGKTYGVATKASLVSVRVLDCRGNGDDSAVIAGLDWVAKHAVQPAVLNASIGGEKSPALNTATTALSDAGVLPVLAAGNDAKDACEQSPASAQRVVTVAASNRSDEQSTFSNWGPCVNLYAPGEGILSAKLGGGSASRNGTSMAAPHATGVAVLYKQEHPAADPAETAEFLETTATRNVLTKLNPTSPNALLFTDGL
ncbi:S8 family peptidase [Streptomyces sp. NPDC088197]|uniref:S8 family peptidase n=1 Tax=Streptomyces sp. NPDC088197 TaxID=3365840 RepID=UPI00380EE748